MKHIVELTYQELVSIIRDQFLNTPDDLEVKITDYPHAVQSLGNTPWYPDDSGEWREYDGNGEPPDELFPDDEVVWMVQQERDLKTMTNYNTLLVKELHWDCVVAYKVVS